MKAEVCLFLGVGTQCLFRFANIVGCAAIAYAKLFRDQNPAFFFAAPSIHKRGLIAGSERVKEPGQAEAKRAIGNA
jgi:hypothetical protein